MFGRIPYKRFYADFGGFDYCRHLSGAGSEFFSTMAGSIRESSYARIFDWDWRSSHNSLKQFLAGIAITVAINGLDQNMMQKSLTCRSLRDCRINMYSFSFLFLLTNVLFLALGALLYIYAEMQIVELPGKSDDVFAFYR